MPQKRFVLLMTITLLWRMMTSEAGFTAPGGDCSSGKCFGNNEYCNTTFYKCACRVNFVATESKTCVQKFCTVDDDCANWMNSICKEKNGSKFCTCRAMYSPAGDQGECTKNGDAFLETSVTLTLAVLFLLLLA